MLIFTSVFTRNEINANEDVYGFQVLVMTPVALSLLLCVCCNTKSPKYKTLCSARDTVASHKIV